MMAPKEEAAAVVLVAVVGVMLLVDCVEEVEGLVVVFNSGVLWCW